MNIYTADLHLGHANILKHCNRPFADLDAMHRHYIETFQRESDRRTVSGSSAISPTVAGASRMALIESLFAAIPSRKHLVVGNHDIPRIRQLGWSSVHEIAEIRDGDQMLVL